VNAFDMPLWHWSGERGTFEKCFVISSRLVFHLTFRSNRASHPLTVSGSAESRVLSVRNRLNIIKQSVLRNEHFAPSTLPSRDRERLVTLKSTKQLLGRASERFLLLGMLAHNKEGRLCVEDADGSVELDLSKLVSRVSLLRTLLRPECRCNHRMNQEKAYIPKGVLRSWKASTQKTAH
jgi:DNA polymerase epsilon subunit 2